MTGRSPLTDDLVRPCRCGHVLGDHDPDPPHRCCQFDRRQQVLFGKPLCQCPAFEEAR